MTLGNFLYQTLYIDYISNRTDNGDIHIVSGCRLNKSRLNRAFVGTTKFEQSNNIINTIEMNRFGNKNRSIVVPINSNTGLTQKGAKLLIESNIARKLLESSFAEMELQRLVAEDILIILKETIRNSKFTFVIVFIAGTGTSFMKKIKNIVKFNINKKISHLIVFTETLNDIGLINEFGLCIKMCISEYNLNTIRLVTFYQ